MRLVRVLYRLLTFKLDIKMYILSMSKKAFVYFEDNEDVRIVSTPDKATKYEAIGDAMKDAIRLNDDFEADITKVLAVE